MMKLSNLPGPRGRNSQPRHAQQAQFDATTRFDCTGRLGEITSPTLIVNGKSDRIAPPSFGEEMRDKIPDARLVLIDGGHLSIFTTQPARLVSEVTAFLPAN